jgi:hypothetical protein
MVPGVACGDCQTPILDENPSGDPADRKPCPNCGSIKRAFSVQLAEELRATGSFTVVLISYPDKLLETAKRLFSEGEWSIAVVVAHMACEVAVERTLSQAFKSRGIENLEDAVTGMMSGYNLGNEKNCKLFIDLTGKAIKSEAFWQKFAESATRRNKAIHEGRIATEQEATESLAATTAFVAYLK